MAGQGTPNNNSDLLHAQSTITSSLTACYNFRSKNLGKIELILRDTVTDHKLAPSSRQALVDDAFGCDRWNDLRAFPIRFGRRLRADLAPEDANARPGLTLNIAGSGEPGKTGRWVDADSTGQSGHG
jgi:hypothetical protein